MNALARAADTVTDAAGHSGMKNDNFKDGEMRLTVGLALTLAIMTCGAQARNMQSIEHSGELKVGVPGDYAPLAFRNAAGELQGYDVDMARDLGRTLGLKVSFVYTSWPALAADLQADKFDIAMGGVTETPARAQAFALSHPVVANGKIAFRQLQVFEAVARLESYSRAQQELGISVSAISNAMSQLEGQLGFTLCQRGRGGFSLTEKGQQFLQQAIRVLSELNELERQSALLKGEHSGTLCISTLDSIETETALSLPVVLRSFSDKFPHVHIKLIIRTPAEQLNGVLNNHIDLAIGSYNSQVHNIISEPLYREQHWLYCSDLHPMFFSRQLDKEQISQCPLVTRSYWNTSDLRRRGFSKGSATVETVDAQLLLILSGKYIGYLPEHYAWPWIKENRLRVLLPNEFGFQSPFSAICKRGRSNEPYLKAFRDLLKKNTVARPKWNY
ncbi:TPA: LysR substrate-binding domain-containing protein [Klebsiella pneumoniae]